ncbi:MULTISPECIES: HAMP domain-containing protein [Vibrio]|uniref:HAMP domain-containing protein n=1 Tax=Vibrio TaxID=662 RepID=UPI003D0A47EC
MLRALRLPTMLKGIKIWSSKRLIWRVLFIALISAVINATQFYFFYAQTLDVLAQRLSFQLLPEELNAVAQSLPSMYEAMSNWLLLLLLLQLVLATWAGCWLSYRLYGPVARIRHALVDISMGKLSTVIHVRDGDELTDIAEDINDSSARLQIVVMSMKDNLDMIDGCDLPAETTLRLETIRENLAYFETINLADTAAKPNEPTQ